MKINALLLLTFTTWSLSGASTILESRHKLVASCVKNIADAPSPTWDDTHFRCIKKIFSLLPARIPLPFNAFDETYTEAIKEKIESTDCGHFADFMTRLFSGKSNITERLIDIREALTEVNLNSDEYYGTYGEFLQTHGASYQHPVANALLCESLQPKHTVFYVNVEKPCHTFVVEKKSDGRETRWRIYQSWRMLFAATMWLGLCPWNNTLVLQVPRYSARTKEIENLFKEFQTLYGNGNWLTREQIMHFMANPAQGYARAPKNHTPYYIRMFTVDQTLIPAYCKALTEHTHLTRLLLNSNAPIISPQTTESLLTHAARYSGTDTAHVLATAAGNPDKK